MTKYVAYDSITCTPTFVAATSGNALAGAVAHNNLDDDHFIVVVEMSDADADRAIGGLAPIMLADARRLGRVDFEGIGTRRQRHPDAA